MRSNFKTELWFGIAAIILAAFAFIISPPDDFPKGAVISVVPGENLNDVTRALRNAHVIRSSSSFQTLAILFGGEKKTIAGDYLFKDPENAIEAAWRVIHGDFGQPEVKTTFPEGFTNAQIAATLATKLPQISAAGFANLAALDQGYLFPDTYYFPLSATSSEVIARMRENFNVKIKAFLPAIAASGKSEADIVIMASILEAEATSTSDREIVAGILWKRLDEGIPLEVDSAPDTYKTKGLPALPIDNPGRDSILAALNPTATNYLYYLTGNDGVMHYSATFSEHEKNIQKYLK